MPANRRRFLCVALGAGSSLSLCGGAWLWNRRTTGSDLTATAVGGDLQITSRTSWALGSNVTITALDADRSRAEQGIAAAFAELELVEQVMSLYRPDSQLCRLNRTGSLDDPHEFLVQVLHTSLDLSERTEGAFDVTVQPLWELYSHASKSQRLPSSEEIEQARGRIDWRRIQLSPRRIEIAAGTQITLNGIAQGFAADRAVAALKSHGIEHALVNTGEIGTVGGRTSEEPWKVGIQHPREPDAYHCLARLAGRSLATSGDYETRFSDDYSQHHIFDPHTGSSPPEFASVSIAAPSGMQADALSTAVFVLGLDRGLELIETLPGVDALLVRKDGRAKQTAGFPAEAS